MLRISIPDPITYSYPDEFKLCLPLFVGGSQRLLVDGTLSKPTKKHWLNLNNYRNWHYQTLNNTKKKFKDQIKAAVKLLPDLTEIWGQVRLDYIYYPKTARLADVGNIVSVVDKYFCDALVELGRMKDDNSSFLVASSWEFGEIDRKNPRLEVYIRPYNVLKDKTQDEDHSKNYTKTCSDPVLPVLKESPSLMPDINTYTPRKITPQNKATLPSTHQEEKRISYMQVHLNEAEMQEAVRNYIRGQVPIQDGDEMPVVFVAGRGDNGHSAQVTILANPAAVTSPERPSNAVPTYEESNKTAVARNAAIEEAAEETSDDDSNDHQGEPHAPPVDEAPDTKASDEATAPVENPDEPVSEPETEVLNQVADARDGTDETEAQPVQKRKASSLFGGKTDEAPTTQALTPNDSQTALQTSAETIEKPKSTSIFDNL